MFIHSLGGGISTNHQEKSSLEDNEMLTDRHISVVNYLLEKEFPQIKSLYTNPSLTAEWQFQTNFNEGGFMTEGLIVFYTQS